jgi:prolipoprotein diacylglyceryl transferase
VFGSIPSPGANGIQVGPLFLHAYGLCYGLAVIAAVIVCSRRWKAVGGDGALIEELAIWGFPAGIVGGRLYHVLTSWNEVPHTWWGPFAIWQGGMGIWGGITLGALVGLWRASRHGVDLKLLVDAGAPSLLVAQAIGRVGNWFNQELYGKPTSLPWGLQIDPEFRPARYADVATFHPVFLYEIIWCLGLAALLVWLGHHRRIRPPGLFALYVAGYSAFRIFAELIRVDPAAYVFGVRWNLLLAIVLTLVGLAWFVRIQRGGDRAAPRRPAARA